MGRSDPKAPVEVVVVAAAAADAAVATVAAGLSPSGSGLGLHRMLWPSACPAREDMAAENDGPASGEADGGVGLAQASGGAELGERRAGWKGTEEGSAARGCTMEARPGGSAGPGADAVRGLPRAESLTSRRERALPPIAAGPGQRGWSWEDGREVAELASMAEAWGGANPGSVCGG
jgi:hypothetical protein